MQKAFDFLIVSILLAALILAVSSCTSAMKRGRNIKKAPEYVGVDVNAMPYVKEFFELSTQNNIKFKKNVSLGFKQINQGNIIGLCTYQSSFREIDLDIAFWKRASEKQRKALLYHELIHCYCTRGHDFAKDKEYPNTLFDNVFNMLSQNVPWCIAKNPGYFDDQCPVTIMHPTILDDTCLNAHWDHYMKEMFDRCEAF